MDDDNKTREQLLQEVIDLRKQIEICNREIRAQKEFFENLIQNSAVPTFVLDTSHRVTLWNRACEEMTGMRSEDIIGTDKQWKPFHQRKRQVLADFIIDGKTEDLSLFYTMHSKSKFIPEGLRAEGWYPNIGGMEHYISFNAAPIRNSAGELIAVVETFEDLSEIKWTEKTIEESKKRYRILFEESPAAMLVINPDSMSIAGANKAAASYYGYTMQELTGKSLTEIIVPPSEPVFQMLRETVHGSHLVQIRNRLRNGEIRDVDLSLRPINMNGKTYLFSDIHDITNRLVVE